MHLKTNTNNINNILVLLALASLSPILSVATFHFSSSGGYYCYNTRGQNFGSSHNNINFLGYNGGHKEQPLTIRRSAAAAVDSTEKSQFTSNMSSTSMNSSNPSSAAVELSFSHVHMYVDYVDDIESYKRLEDCLNQFATQVVTVEERSTTAKLPNYDDGDYLSTCRTLWNQLLISNNKSNVSINNVSNNKNENDENFSFCNRDIVRQLVSGLGFRVTAARMSPSSSLQQREDQDHSDLINTRSVLVTSCDAQGVQFVVTSLPRRNNNGAQPDTATKNIDEGSNQEPQRDFFDHFDQSHLHRFYSHYNNRQGIAVLGFEVTNGSIHDIYFKYQQHHPNLLSHDVREYSTAKVLEVYAYYAEDNTAPERGTLLRFIQKKSSSGTVSSQDRFVLPGLTPISATFDPTCYPAYCDHWVSNVFSRTSFLKVLYDSLGFTTKVNFNAGVVAAGEAQIESTVSGNSLPAGAFTSEDSSSSSESTSIVGQKKALSDQRQVYLPINNALSSVGHVHWFLKEIGQGVQHIASRVEDLATFVSRANHYRKVTGDGLTFLNIPRSYYGVLSTNNLQRLLGSNYWQDKQKQQSDTDESHHVSTATDGAVLSQSCASEVMKVLEACKFVAADGSVNLNLVKEDIESALNKSLQECAGEDNGGVFKEYVDKREYIFQTILRSRYINLYTLLLDRLDENLYLKIVKNKILVDVQGNDLLFQIFTCNILQRNSGEEAPFLEFIQRSCGTADQAATAGCGGFGIRNFLTLFLSIELSKAMKEAQSAKLRGDVPQQTYCDRMISLFTDQLNESNPILTEIADCMTGEGRAKDMISMLQSKKSEEDEAAIKMWSEEMNAYEASKRMWNARLMECSLKYKTLMKKLREDYEKERDLL